MAKKAESGDRDSFHWRPQECSTLERCRSCKGSGQVWVKWWSKHEKDWREAIAIGKDVPSVAEFSRCERCLGSMVAPVDDRATVDAVRLIQWVVERNLVRLGITKASDIYPLEGCGE